jgi:hypothetical protein
MFRSMLVLKNVKFHVLPLKIYSLNIALKIFLYYPLTFLFYPEIIVLLIHHLSENLVWASYPYLQMKDVEITCNAADNAANHSHDQTKIVTFIWLCIILIILLKCLHMCKIRGQKRLRLLKRHLLYIWELFADFWLPVTSQFAHLPWMELFFILVILYCSIPVLFRYSWFNLKMTVRIKPSTSGPEVPKLWGANLLRADVVCTRDTFWTKYGRKIKYIFWYALCLV